MKKYSFLIYHQDYTSFLNDIQDIGVLHVKEKGSGEIEDEELKENYRLLNEYKNTISFLSRRNTEHVNEKPVQDANPDEILEQIASSRNEIEDKQQQLQALKKEIAQLEPWGDFSFDMIKKLEDAGIKIRFFTVASKRFQDDWKQKYFLEVINHVGPQIYFVVFQKKHEDIDVEAEEIILPEHALSDLEASAHELEHQLKEKEISLDVIAVKYLSILEKSKDELKEKTDFQYVLLNTEKKAEDKLMLLEGFIPKTKEEALKTFLSDNDVVYTVSSPEKSEKVPILLKNNKFARLCESIGELYSLPNYGEIDLTPFFAPFFMMFFGFCLGDAGYGLLFVIGASLYKLKAKESFKPVLSLIQFLGIATVLFGIIGGTFFGINLFDTHLPIYSELQERFQARDSSINDFMFKFALMLGGIQIIFGMIIKALNLYKQFGINGALSTIGWIFIIVGGIAVYGLNSAGIISPEHFKTGLYIILGIGGVFIFILNDIKRNVFVNIGAGVWDTYNMLSGRLGDLLSYIRLFALGISSAILGFVFNDLAVNMSPDVPVIGQLVFIIILLIGHGINIFMSGLGSFVHPLRLTFVEFYSNAGFSGGGKKYEPFRKITNV